MALARRLSSLGRAARAEAGDQGAPAAGPGPRLPAAGQPRPAAGRGRGRAQRRRGGGRSASSATSSPTSWSPTSRLLGPRLGVAGPAAPRRPWARSTARRPRRRWPPAGRWWSSSTTARSSSAADEVELRVQAQPGFAVSRDGAEVVALDLTLDDDLRRRGLAREVIRHVQDLRKASGLEVSDWIHLHLVGLDDLEPLFDAIAREVLARSVSTVASRRRRSRAPTLELDDGETVREVDGSGWSRRDRAGPEPGDGPRRAVRAGRRPRHRRPQGGGGGHRRAHRGPRHRAGGARTCSTAAGPSRTRTSGGRPSAPPPVGPWPRPRCRPEALIGVGCTAQWSGTVAVGADGPTPDAGGHLDGLAGQPGHPRGGRRTGQRPRLRPAEDPALGAGDRRRSGSLGQGPGRPHPVHPGRLPRRLPGARPPSSSRSTISTSGSPVAPAPRSTRSPPTG